MPDKVKMVCLPEGFGEENALEWLEAKMYTTMPERYGFILALNATLTMAYGEGEIAEVVKENSAMVMAHVRLMPLEYRQRVDSYIESMARVPGDPHQVLRTILEEYKRISEMLSKGEKP